MNIAAPSAAPAVTPIAAADVGRDTPSFDCSSCDAFDTADDSEDENRCPNPWPALSPAADADEVAAEDSFDPNWRPPCSPAWLSLPDTRALVCVTA
ncbi:hypothetical protein [Prescottella equi]|uniref:hypothetical protein n=1 Tax=Rhodococcus hoagii TaxID=43767 RepID=UPI0020C672D8|nr:hypothetical protein [Prescottella equi]